MPRNEFSSHETVKPIRFPPAIYSLTVPKPSIPPSGAKAYFVKSLQKIKNIKIEVSKIIVHKPDPNATIRNVKVYLVKNLKKVEKIKNNMGKKAKPPVTGVAETDDKMNKSDTEGFESSFSDFDDFTPSHRTFSGYSTPFSSSSPRRTYSFQSPKTHRLRSMQKGLMKWSFLKRNSGKY
ncbi:hypothetical protein M5689_023162 [Euphorbia peplus]|nr:hypothetical protein M5689_023162 [Euphorbia peplus]